MCKKEERLENNSGEALLKQFAEQSDNSPEENSTGCGCGGCGCGNRE